MTLHTWHNVTTAPHMQHPFPVDPYFGGSYGNAGRGYFECFLVSKSFKEVVLLCGTLPLPTEHWHASGKAVYVYTDKTRTFGLASIKVLSAGSPGEVTDGLVHNLWSNDRGGSESHSMSFTQPDLIESRVTGKMGIL